MNMIWANEVMNYLRTPELRAKTSAALIRQTDTMRGRGGYASERAAEVVLELIKS